MTARTALPANPFPAPERVLPTLTRIEEYEIERVLAQGSFAVVYRAYDHALKLHVAIKEYLPDALALRSAEVQLVPRTRAHAERFETGRQAFIVEAQTLARCDHPALLRIMRILQRHGTAYRVMRYCPGPTMLAQRRDMAEAPALPMLRMWLDNLLGALQALHEEGCVHGAVAPGNILLGPDGRPLLLDFDAVRATLISDRTQSMMAALEPCFAPIEQRQPAPHLLLGPWTDLYSLAASLHFCVSGQLPAPPSSDAAVALEPLSPLWQRRGLADGHEAEPLLDAIDACLADLPQHRPQSVAEFRAMLGPGVMPAARPAAVSASAQPAQPQPAKPVAAMATPAMPMPKPAAAFAAAPARPNLTGPSSLTEADTAGDLSARIIADLDQTFAKIAAHAQDTTANPDAGSSPPAAAGFGVPLPPGNGGVSVTSAATAVPLFDVSLAAVADTVPEMAAEHLPTPEPRPDIGQPASGHARWLRTAGALALSAALVALAAWWVAMGDAGERSADPHAAPAATSLPPAQATLPDDAGPLPPPGAGKPAAAAEPPRDTAPTADAQSALPPPAKAAPAPKPKPKATTTATATATTTATPAATKVAASPREVCGNRTQFALYQCMQTQCATSKWSAHGQCVKLRQSDSVD